MSGKVLNNFKKLLNKDRTAMNDDLLFSIPFYTINLSTTFKCVFL